MTGADRIIRWSTAGAVVAIAAAGASVAVRRAGEAAAKVPLGCLARLQHAFEASHATPDPRPGAAAAVPGLVEALTARELEVLGMLASGRSNQAIARASLW